MGDGHLGVHGLHVKVAVVETKDKRGDELVATQSLSMVVKIARVYFTQLKNVIIEPVDPT